MEECRGETLPLGEATARDQKIRLVSTVQGVLAPYTPYSPARCEPSVISRQCCPPRDSAAHGLGRGLGSTLFSALLSLAPHPFLAAAPLALPLLIGFAPGAHAQTTPTVSIARQGSGSVTEGSDVVFRVTASRAVDANLTVNLFVADSSIADFVSSGNEGSQSVVIASGAPTADFTLSTKADTTDEPSGGVSVTVNSSAAYTWSLVFAAI